MGPKISISKLPNLTIQANSSVNLSMIARSQMARFVTLKTILTTRKKERKKEKKKERKKEKKKKRKKERKKEKKKERRKKERKKEERKKIILFATT